MLFFNLQRLTNPLIRKNSSAIAAANSYPKVDTSGSRKRIKENSAVKIIGNPKTTL